MEKARIHSIETMGLVDGPGIRVVVFMQGCKLRCAYCHNPDTWNMGGGYEISSHELLEKVKRYKGFFKASGGGVTLSGGDPLLQAKFTAEFFSLCRKEDIHTALDTSGYGFGEYDDVLKNTDLVILDIKHINDSGYRELTGWSMDGLFQFLAAVKRNNNRLWLRHVVVPGLTDSEEHIKMLGQFVKTIPNVDKVELLPYHVHGVNKYRELGIKYRLEGVPPLEEEKLEKLYKVLDASIKNEESSGNSGIKGNESIAV